MSLVSINPATGVAFASYAEHTSAQIEAALVQGVAAQRRWAALPATERARCLRGVAEALLQHQDELAAVAAAEMGKPLAQGRSEVEKCARACDYFAEHGPALLAAERPLGAPADARVRLEPLGLVLGIMPWNFPFWQLLRAAAPTLLGGNGLVVKHAPNVTGCALALERVLRAGGLPRGVVQLLHTHHAAIPALIADARIRAVTFTGSTVTGKKIAALAGAAMKPGVYELGGSDPYIVLDDADLAAAAEVCAASRVINCGQTCTSAKRIIVARAVRKEFETLLTARLAARRTGDPMLPETDIGPLARADLRRTLHRQITASVRRGARLLLGGQPLPSPGFFYATTLLSGVKPGMPAADEELFGPAAAILVARNDAEAVRLANATPYGLGAAIFTRDVARAEALIPHIQAGCVAINQRARSDPSLPFGGTKDSGMGRELGSHGLRAFLNVKTVTG